MNPAISGFRFLASFRSGAFLRILAVGALLPIFGSLPLPGQLLVEWQNIAGVSQSAMEEMGATGEHALSSAAIPSHWRNMDDALVEGRASLRPGNMPARAERRVIVRLVSSRSAFSANPRCLGEALVTDGGGTLAIVYVDRVRAFATKHRLPVGIVLGYAAAHEVGHLLLGSTEHSDRGLMDPSWGSDEVREMRSGKLTPGDELAERMIAGVAASAPLYASSRSGGSLGASRADYPR